VNQHGARHLQRAFTSFPSGWAGTALLVLRVVVGASATLQAGLFISDAHTVRVATLAAILMAIAGLALLVGFLTPIASVLVCLGGMGIMLTCTPPLPLLLFHSRMAAFEFAVMSAVLVILGPGAISLDARLFGRRKIAIRPQKR
jgi:putative oxidoreductase